MVLMTGPLPVGLLLEVCSKLEVIPRNKGPAHHWKHKPQPLVGDGANLDYSQLLLSMY